MELPALAVQKRSSSVEDALLPIIAISTLMGSNARNFAVRMIVMMIETLRLPPFSHITEACFAAVRKVLLRLKAKEHL